MITVMILEKTHEKDHIEEKVDGASHIYFEKKELLLGIITYFEYILYVT